MLRTEIQALQRVAKLQAVDLLADLESADGPAEKLERARACLLACMIASFQKGEGVGPLRGPGRSDG